MSDPSMILLVSNDAALRRDVRAVMEPEGFTFCEVDTAERIVPLVLECQPAVLVLDIDLPPGGLDLLRTLRASPLLEISRLPVLLLTGTMTFESGDETMRGISDITVKPVHPSSLLRRLRQLLRLAQLRIEQDRRQQAEHRLMHVITGARCILWSATVRRVELEMYDWQMQVFNEESAREFFPVAIPPGQTYTLAWENSKLEEDFVRTAKTFRAALASGASGYTQEYRCHTLRGVRWLYEDVQIQPASPNQWTLVGVCTDITERKESEQVLRDTNDALERRIEERTHELRESQRVLQIKSDSLAVINRIADTLYQSLDFATVVEQAVESLVNQAGFSAAAIYVYEESSERVRLVAMRGFSEDIAEIGATMPLGDNLTSLAIRARQIMISEDIATDARVDTNTSRLFVRVGLVKAVIVPLTLQERVLGGMTLYLRADAAIDSDKLEMASAISKTVAVAMANADYVARVRAERDHRQRAEAAEREQRLLAEALRDAAGALSSSLLVSEVMERVLDYVTKVIPADACNITLIEHGEVRVVVVRGYDADTEALLRAVRFTIDDTQTMRTMLATLKPLTVPDTRHFIDWVHTPSSRWQRSWCGAPIVVDNRVIGFLNLDSRTPGQFTEKHAGQLQAFANQAGIAIQNAHNYQAVRRHATELEQRIAERTDELLHERAQLSTILDAMSEGVIYDEAFRVRYVNSAFTRLTGYRANEISDYTEILRGSATSLDHLTWLLAEIYEAVHNMGVWQGETRIRRKDGGLFDASVTCTRVRDGDGAMIGTVTIIRDISRDKALNLQKSRFVARASHELRTPIANLKTRLYLIPRQAERAEEHMRVIGQVTEHMERLVQDLLDMSRFERGVVALDRRELVLQSLLRDLAAVQGAEAETHQQRLTLRMPETPVVLFADPTRLMQVLTNLVSNAIKYTPAQGQITLTMTTSGTHAEILVADTGIGIAPEDLPYVFDAFFRVAEDTQGTGLGLSIAREIVELHRGDLSVESELGQGSRFRVRLPLAQRTAPETA